MTGEAAPRAWVCLSFDFDAMSSWIYRGQTSPTPLSRGEYGARVGVPRVLELLDRFEIPATFFVPGHSADTWPHLVREIAARGHELGNHGYLHEVPSALDTAAERAVIRRGNEAIERAAGVRPRGFRSPSWDLSPHTLDILRELDFVYDSSLMGDDFHLYWCRTGDVVHTDRAFQFGRETDLVEMPVHWLLDDVPYFQYSTQTRTGLTPASQVYEIWQDEFDYLYDRVPGGVFTLTMHPQVIGRGHRMMMLERLVRHMRARAGVRFATQITVAEAWRAAQRAARTGSPAGSHP
jgi:peptidoglycan/xylan/chitin deacetylase (PgdA/CDA1 family)